MIHVHCEESLRRLQSLWCFPSFSLPKERPHPRFRILTTSVTLLWLLLLLIGLYIKYGAGCSLCSQRQQAGLASSAGDSTAGVAVVVGGLGSAPDIAGDDPSTHALIR